MTTIITNQAQSSEVLNESLEDELKEELLQTFMIEFEELLEIYQSSLDVLRKPNGEFEDAYEDIFRVYHTLKGDAGYFPEFSEFTKFASFYCEELRPLDESVYSDVELREELVENYRRLSKALSQFNKGNALQTFRFKLFLRNF